MGNLLFKILIPERLPSELSGRPHSTNPAQPLNPFGYARQRLCRTDRLYLRPIQVRNDNQAFRASLAFSVVLRLWYYDIRKIEKKQFLILFFDRINKIYIDFIIFFSLYLSCYPVCFSEKAIKKENTAKIKSSSGRQVRSYNQKCSFYVLWQVCSGRYEWHGTRPALCALPGEASALLYRFDATGSLDEVL
jgi:hypothetical protein